MTTAVEVDAPEITIESDEPEASWYAMLAMVMHKYDIPNVALTLRDFESLCSKYPDGKVAVVMRGTVNCTVLELMSMDDAQALADRSRAAVH